MDISTHHSKVLEKELTNELKDEVNVNYITMDNEGIYVNVTLRGKLYNLIKENLIYIHTKITKLMSCTANTVETIFEPVEIEKIETSVEEPVVKEETVVTEVPLITEEPVVNEVQMVDIEEPVTIEKPIPIEERN
jgi:hypothetical protein